MGKLVKASSSLPVHVVEDRVVQRLQEAEKALGYAVGIDQVRLVMDAAAAQEVFAKRQKLGEEVISYAHTIKTRALGRLGELLREIEKHEGGRPKTRSNVEQVSASRSTLSDLGIDRKTSMVAQQLASLPAETREAIAQREITLHDVLGQQRRVERVERIQEVTSNNTALETDKPVPILYADPPWRYEHVKTDNRAIENQYPTLSLEEICALPVNAAATPDAVLFMWATSPKLAESFEVLRAWGFTYRTCMVWVKDKIGMGYYARQQQELLLIATKGEPPVPEPSSRPASVVTAPRGDHSAKPEVFYEVIERMYPEFQKRELFARQTRAGWVAWGNQAA